MERSPVLELISSTNVSLPVGSVTYPGNFEESVAASVAAQELGIEGGFACGRYFFLYSLNDLRELKDYMQKKRLEDFYI